MLNDSTQHSCFDGSQMEFNSLMNFDLMKIICCERIQLAYKIIAAEAVFSLKGRTATKNAITILGDHKSTEAALQI